MLESLRAIGMIAAGPLHQVFAQAAAQIAAALTALNCLSDRPGKTAPGDN